MALSELWGENSGLKERSLKMQLRNKKTGEIGNLALNINPNRESYSVLSTENGDTVCGNLVIADYNSLAELNEEWEDAPEEPKEYWYIDTSMMEVTYNTLGAESDVEEFNKEIGNYFETEEEAELAVRKLKAWKRLKDKGFRFDGKEVFSEGQLEIDGVLSALKKADNAERLKIVDGLELLFGGEE